MDIYSTIGWITIGIGVAVMVVSPLVRRLMHLDTLKDEDEELAGYKEVGGDRGQDAGMFPQRETKLGKDLT